MGFTLSLATSIKSDINTKPVDNAIEILKRDMAKVLTETGEKNSIVLKRDKEMGAESYRIELSGEITIYASDDLGFIYALLHISEKYLGIKPFWFWLDQKIEKKGSVTINESVITSPKYAVRFRGWFFNDEVLFLKWTIDGSSEKVWRMAFETLLRCGGNMTIPGTDKNSRQNRGLAAEMGLWITHHHAEPLGAEIFVRAYPNDEASYFKNPDKFRQLWEDAAKEQQNYKVIWNLCFRGQGDTPFWSNDTSGKYDTDEKRGALITSIIKEQADIVRKYVKEPVFCTNLYGEIMELYSEGHINLDEDMIKVMADNGYGKMVARRRDNHSRRVSSMPRKGGGKQGIYYHVSFYDLQAANHITMLPNSVSFVNDELNAVLENDGGEFWIVNCSNVKPHAYYLDAVRKKWLGEEITDKTHSREFAADYYGTDAAAKAFEEYPNAMISFGKNEDEHAGEQFYTENARVLSHNLITGKTDEVGQLKWCFGEGSLFEIADKMERLIASGEAKIKNYLDLCQDTYSSLTEGKELFGATVLLQAKIHFSCAMGLKQLCGAICEFGKGEYKKAFMLSGSSAEYFDSANSAMRESEDGVWKGYYYNDCFADVKHSAYMARKMMGVIREYGDNARHDKWYRDTFYTDEDRGVFMLLVLDNHPTDEELYKAMKEKNI